MNTNLQHELTFTNWQEDDTAWVAQVDNTHVRIQNRGTNKPTTITILKSDIFPTANVYEKRYMSNAFGTLRPGQHPHLFLFSMGKDYQIKGTYFAKTNNLVLRLYNTTKIQARSVLKL